jgi:RNA recognition motif-containing protein
MAATPGSIILVAGIGEQFDNSTLHGVVSERCGFGSRALKWVSIEYSKTTNQSRGFAFCEFDRNVRPSDAAKNLDGLSVGNSPAVRLTARVATGNDLKRFSRKPSGNVSADRHRIQPPSVLERKRGRPGSDAYSRQPRPRYDGDRGYSRGRGNDYDRRGGGGGYDRSTVQLFIGNAPPDITSLQLKDFLNQAVRQGGLRVPNARKRDPVLSIRLGRNYAFAEFSDPETCSLALNLHGIKLAQGIFLKVSRPKNYNGPMSKQVTWYDWMQERLRSHPQLDGRVIGMPTAEEYTNFLRGGGGGRGVMGGDGGSRRNLSSRQVYVGNCPYGIKADDLINFFSQAMIQCKLTLQPGLPIVNCRINNKFAFLEFRSDQEATNALHMNGIKFIDNELKVNRPKSYNGPPDSKVASWKALLQTNFDLPKAILLANSAATGTMRSETFVDMNSVPPAVRVGFQAGMPSKTVVFAGLDGIGDAVAGIEGEAKRYGKITSMDFNKEKGALYLVLESHHDAGMVVLGMSGRSLDGKNVEVRFGQ